MARPKTGKAKGGKKNRKFGNNKKFCTRYLAENRELTNRKRKVKKHLSRHPDDAQNAGVLKRL